MAQQRPYLPRREVARTPDIPLPPGACDAHCHVFGPAHRFAFAASRAYTPDDAPVEALLDMHARLGIQRAVVVQGNPHGTDNSALLDTLATYPQRLRGVAIVEATASRTELKRMRDAGVRALRFHHLPRMAGRYSSVGIDAMMQLAPHMAELGMHIQLFMDAARLPEVLARLQDWRLPIVLDHFGSIVAADGATGEGFKALTRYLGEGRIWIKLSAPYRCSELHPDYDDVRVLHELLVRTNPEQLLWGTDWPHTRLERFMPDDGHLVDLLSAWTPGAARDQILVDNPARLFGF